MMARDLTDAETWLLSLPPTRRQTRWAIAVAGCQIAGFALLVPFAAVQVQQLNGFIPSVECAEFMSNLVTAVSLLSQFATHRRIALLALTPVMQASAAGQSRHFHAAAGPITDLLRFNPPYALA